MPVIPSPGSWVLLLPVKVVCIEKRVDLEPLGQRSCSHQVSLFPVVGAATPLESLYFYKEVKEASL